MFVLPFSHEGPLKRGFALDSPQGLALGLSKLVPFGSMGMGAQGLDCSLCNGLTPLLHPWEGLARGFEHGHEGAIRQGEKGGKVYRG